jgi:ATP phosphoribosyltransferase regulatory subunit
MTMQPAWLLPEHIEDILPPYARAAEALRRQLLDLFDRHGYDLVTPPLVEYLESLLTGAARDLDLKTFKVMDGLSGRMLGVRADMTPQAARIDAHLLNHQGVARLCYAGPVLRTRPAGLMAGREPFQIGAELFGHAGIEADLEIQGLLLAALRLEIGRAHV